MDKMSALLLARSVNNLNSSVIVRLYCLLNSAGLSRLLFLGNVQAHAPVLSQRTRVVAGLRGEGTINNQIRIGDTGGHYDDKK